MRVQLARCQSTTLRFVVYRHVLKGLFDALGDFPTYIGGEAAALRSLDGLVLVLGTLWAKGALLATCLSTRGYQRRAELERCLRIGTKGQDRTPSRSLRRRRAVHLL